MTKKLLTLLALLPASSALAATYNIDFSSAPYSPLAPLDGLDGWSQNSPNAAPDSPVAWVYNKDGIVGGAFGGYYDSPGAVPFTANRAFNSLPSGEKTFHMAIEMIDSTDEAPDRDTFGYKIQDGGGDTLLTVSLVPNAPAGSPEGDEAIYTVFYAFGDGPLISSGNAILEEGVYNFDLALTAAGAVFSFSNTTQNVTVAGNPTGLDLNDTTLGLFVNWDGGLGDNFLLISSITAVPEPSGAVLLGVGALGFLARRRRC